MPNWCDNSLILRNKDTSKIDSLSVKMESEQTPFDYLRPPPEDIGDGRYEWNLFNWGTKWEANMIDWERSDDNEIRIYFESAWCPPIALYNYLVEEGWEVEAVYNEPGCQFAGLFTNESGDQYYDYDIRDQNTIDDLPTDIVEFAGLEDANSNWWEDRLQEAYEDWGKTDWISAKNKPVHAGVYEVKTKSWHWVHYCEWNGKTWESTGKVTEWRGLSKEMTDADLQGIRDNIIENN